MGRKRKKLEKQFVELLGLVRKEDKPKALKLMCEIFCPPATRPPPPAEMFSALDIIAEEMKKSGIPV